MLGVDIGIGRVLERLDLPLAFAEELRRKLKFALLPARDRAEPPVASLAARDGRELADLADDADGFVPHGRDPHEEVRALLVLAVHRGRVAEHLHRALEDREKRELVAARTVAAARFVLVHRTKLRCVEGAVVHRAGRVVHHARETAHVGNRTVVRRDLLLAAASVALFKSVDTLVVDDVREGAAKPRRLVDAVVHDDELPRRRVRRSVFEKLL